MATPHSAVNNADVDWSRFDPTSYVAKNYAWVHEEDAELLPILLEFVSQLPNGLDVVDVGIGPNLYPSLAALSKARTLTGWEFGSRNLAYLHECITSLELPTPWGLFWDEIVRLRPDYQHFSPCSLLRLHMSLRHGSIFDLPAARWDFAMMFFCAESCTTNFGEFSLAFRKFLGCVRQGGYFFAALMENSQGYDVASEHFPAVAISFAEVEMLLQAYAQDYVVRRIQLGDKPIRPGYSGMLAVHGRIP